MDPAVQKRTTACYNYCNHYAQMQRSAMRRLILHPLVKEKRKKKKK